MQQITSLAGGRLVGALAKRRDKGGG